MERRKSYPQLRDNFMTAAETTVRKIPFAAVTKDIIGCLKVKIGNGSLAIDSRNFSLPR